MARGGEAREVGTARAGGMNRDASLRALGTAEVWDVVIIGGGATGLGAALDAATRGLRTALVEQGDFAQETSSRSTKLIHGGVRYLQQGNISLVRSALRERGLLLKSAPGLVRPLTFVIPNYARWEAPFYTIGLKLYDALAGSLGLGVSRHLSRAETLVHLPTVAPRGLRGGVLYHDAQFDDARLAISLAQTFSVHGGIALNYARVTGLLRESGRVAGVRVRDLESCAEMEIRARAVINATGVFADEVRALDDSEASPMLAPSQGAHIVVARDFLPGASAMMIPRTEDARVIFAIPWHDRVLFGTTDTPVANAVREPRPLDAEIEFLLAHAAKHLARAPGRADVLSAFAGLRPLVRRGAGRGAALSRDHVVAISPSGLLTITGGKWTTYRLMAEDVVDAAIKTVGLSARDCVTRELRLIDVASSTKNPSEAEVVHAVREEMARTVEDVLASRSRTLFLDARASVTAAPTVAKAMAAELGRDALWEAEQVSAFAALASSYVCDALAPGSARPGKLSI